MEELKRQREVQERANETITAQLEQLVLTAPRSEVPSPPPDIPPAAPESASPSREPRLPPPERFSGEESGCGPFLTQCSLIFELQPSSFPTDRSRIAYLMTVMSGRALTWASAVWEQKSPGLSGEIKDELAARELPRDINSLIDVATRIDNRVENGRVPVAREALGLLVFVFLRSVPRGH
ncbi:hypothetical protein DPEC_G00183430 [Dallia pectoralis]|uniref:Uncharacterized protein n=1 Tax=Dallia pectoralis TaxID=75939 RepID=A0ACC2GB20_DALPE|nr:hypothetical protein DPEC_G00183430 [Dallia pectoralis]